jgi:anti-anti-sigma factor
LPPLEIEIEQLEDVCVVAVAGEIDLANKDELAQALSPCRGTVVIDLRRVSFIDSSGLGVLAAQSRRLVGDDGRLVLRKPQDNVRRVLEITGFAEWLEHE